MVLHGRYKLRRRIAESNLAELLLASQQGLAGIEQLVVVKRINIQPRSSEAFVRPFVEEVRRSIQLKHQNVAETHHLHHDQDELYVVSHYVSGEDLTFILSQLRANNETVPVPIALEIISQTAAGLAHAHGAGMIHRELCPSNVLVSYNGEVKLTDFGQARADAQDVYPNPATLKNKLAYRSPERLRHKELDERSDVYSLGVLFYELLVGRRLFNGETAADLLKTAMELTVPPPSQVNKSIPSELDDIVMAAIARDKDERTATVEQFSAGLDRALKHSKLALRPSGLAEWMKTTFAPRLAQRQHLEQTLAFNETSTRDGSSVVVPAFAMGASQTTSGMASVASLVGNAPAQPDKSKAALWATIGALATLLILLLLGTVYWMGRQGVREPPPKRTVQPVPPTPAPKVVHSPASFLVHVTPHGATLQIEDKDALEVGPDGLLVPVEAGKNVAVKVSKPGYVTTTKTVRAPPKGTAHVYLNLKRKAAAVVAIAPLPSPSAPPPVAVVPAETTRRPSRPRRPRPRRPARKGKKTVALQLVFSPPGATVSLDGKVRPGGSPLLLSGLKPGTHLLSLRAIGFRSLTQRVELSANQPNVRVKLELEKRIQEVPVRVTSTPTGAQVKINGKIQGSTPLVGLKMEVGRGYLVQLQLPGYRNWSQRIVPSEGARPRLAATLQKKPVRPIVASAKKAAESTKAVVVPPKVPEAPKARGKLYVISPNVYGAVYVNGRPHGYPPVVVPNVLVGSATVEIRVGGRVRRTQTVTVTKGQRVKVRFR